MQKSIILYFKNIIICINSDKITIINDEKRSVKSIKYFWKKS